MFEVIPRDRPLGSCADPTHWPLVDAACERPGGEAAKLMIETLCTGCPIGDACLAHAMTHREHGIWGGTSPYSRTLRGAPGLAKATTARGKDGAP